MKKSQSCIYSALRTPIGRMNGVLASVPAVELGAAVIRELVHRSGAAPDAIDSVILGNVLSAGLGQNPARHAAISGGLPYSVRATLVNKVCGSGLQAVIFADQSLRLGESSLVIAGGMESMSRAPHLLLEYRRERRLDESALIDSVVLDGLCDSFLRRHMGELAEEQARKDGIGRDEQDRYALMSYERARRAAREGRLAPEIVAVGVTGAKIVDADETPDAARLERLPELPPAFLKNGGTITAGNASKLNDGAAALLIGPPGLDMPPLARIVATASHAGPPEEFPIAPVGALRQLARNWGLSLDTIDLFEINEPFAASILSVCRRLNIALERVNVNGGAVALGHPLGASGARILVTLVHALRRENLRRGAAVICLGGGEAVAVGIESA